MAYLVSDRINEPSRLENILIYTELLRESAREPAVKPFPGMNTSVVIIPYQQSVR
jgi:hypothetical protein